MQTVLKVLLGIVLATVLIAAGLALLAGHEARRFWSPDPQTIATASLQSLQSESRLTALVATYVAVVTSSQSRFGLSAQRTLIMPGRVRYEVDLAKLGAGDLTWHAQARTLDVLLPPLLLEGPEVDPARMRAYDAGGLLLRLTDSGQLLDNSNRQAATAELLRQARDPAPMGIAKEAARRAIEQNFALPLKAAGLSPTVRVRFFDDPGFAAPTPFVPMDHSRSLVQVLGLSR